MTVEHISSYPSIHSVGHKLVKDIFASPVVVQEKVDGSQFSFRLSVDGEVLSCRSKGKDLVVDEPEKMFGAAVEVVKALRPNLSCGWTYRGEYLQKPKHNTLTYSRIPANHIILFDVETGGHSYLGPEALAAEAQRLGLEVVPTLHTGMVESLAIFNEFLERESVLGGPKVEGVVAKNYEMFGTDHKPLMTKYVSEAFKESHKKEWRTANPTRMDVVQRLILDYTTTARWEKAVQHLRERGELTDSPKDIGALMREIPLDVEKEEVGAIKDVLYAHAWPHIRRGIVSGVPEWYKQRLAATMFETNP